MVSRWISGGMVAEKNMRLPGEGQELADALDVRDEAHVEHAVGLVDHQHVDAGEEKLAALEMVDQAARRGDDDVRAAVDLQGLRLEGDAADEEGDGEIMQLAQRLEGLAHLVGQFAGGLEDEGARHAGAGAALFQKGEHGQHEGGGLAGARLGEAHHVAALEGGGDGLGLDGRGRGVTRGGDRFEGSGAQPELGERHVYVKNRSGDGFEFGEERAGEFAKGAPGAGN